MTPERETKLRELVGNVIDHWQQLPNDLSSDPAFESLHRAMRNLYVYVTGEAIHETAVLSEYDQCHSDSPFCEVCGICHTKSFPCKAAGAKPAQGSEPSDYFRGQRATVKHLLTLKPEQVHQALLDMQTGMDATLKAPQK